jgi:cell division initiation protein
MKVTPLDLRQTHFKKGLRGYDPEEVRALLTDAADDYESALRDLDRLRQEVQKAEVQLSEYREREANLRNTLLTAQKVADQIRENAAKEADVLMRDAETRAAASLADAETRATSMLTNAETRATSLLKDAEVRSTSLLTSAESRATSMLTEAETRSSSTLRDADTRAAGVLQEADLRADAAVKDANMRADAMLRDAQGRVDLMMQKAHARLDELDHAVSEMRLRKRDVEGTLEQSIASLTYALEFVRTQDQRDDKVRLHRPRLNDAVGEPMRMLPEAEALLG